MKLMVKEKYFKKLKNGSKTVDYRDAHITFVCEETGEKLYKKVIGAKVMTREKSFYPDVLEDATMIVFELEKHKGKKHADKK